MVRGGLGGFIVPERSLPKPVWVGVGWRDEDELGALRELVPVELDPVVYVEAFDGAAISRD